MGTNVQGALLFEVKRYWKHDTEKGITEEDKYAVLTITLRDGYIDHNSSDTATELGMTISHLIDTVNTLKRDGMYEMSKEKIKGRLRYVLTEKGKKEASKTKSDQKPTNQTIINLNSSATLVMQTFLNHPSFKKKQKIFSSALSKGKQWIDGTDKQLTDSMTPSNFGYVLNQLRDIGAIEYADLADRKEGCIICPNVILRERDTGKIIYPVEMESEEVEGVEIEVEKEVEAEPTPQPTPDPPPADPAPSEETKGITEPDPHAPDDDKEEAPRFEEPTEASSPTDEQVKEFEIKDPNVRPHEEVPPADSPVVEEKPVEPFPDPPPADPTQPKEGSPDPTKVIDSKPVINPKPRKGEPMMITPNFVQIYERIIKPPFSGKINGSAQNARLLHKSPKRLRKTLSQMAFLGVLETTNFHTKTHQELMKYQVTTQAVQLIAEYYATKKKPVIDKPDQIQSPTISVTMDTLSKLSVKELIDLGLRSFTRDKIINYPDGTTETIKETMVF